MPLRRFAADQGHLRGVQTCHAGVHLMAFLLKEREKEGSNGLKEPKPGREVRVFKPRPRPLSGSKELHIWGKRGVWGEQREKLSVGSPRKCD